MENKCHQCGEKIVQGAIFCNPQCAENFFYDEDGAIDYADNSPSQEYVDYADFI